MSWLFENPWPVIWLAVLGEALLAVVLYNTGRGAVLGVMGGVAAVALLVVGVEWLVVTDTEEVENALDGLASALEANDLPGVLAHLAPEAAGLRGEAESWLPRLEITEARVTGELKVQVNARSNPPIADAGFVGRISAKSLGAAGAFPFENFIRPFQVKLRKDGDRWLLTEYQIRDTPEGFREGL